MDEGRDEFRNRKKAAAEVNATKFGRCVYASGATSGILQGILCIYIYMLGDSLSKSKII